MNNIDRQYKELLERILNLGVNKTDRTGTGTKSIFGWQIRHNMKEGFPLLTTKKMAWKSIVTELLWFLRGDTNIKFLLDYDCHIWDGDAYTNYMRNWHGKLLQIGPCTKEEFIERIKTDDEFAKKWGDLGPIYGKQWRQWQGWMSVEGEQDEAKYSLWYDQILRLVHLLKTEPDSRRMMVSAWNVAELEEMVLPPCHYGFQVYTRELTTKERLAYYPANNAAPKRAISLMWNQRSVDTFLGLPFNIASYGLLLKILADEVNMMPEDLIGNLGDVHLYSNHIRQAEELLTRTSYELPNVQIMDRNWYLHEKVKEHLYVENDFERRIMTWRPECFTLENYQCHPAIKAPLSN